MAGFCNDSCRVAGREAAAESLGMVVVTLALAVPGRASFLHFHGPPLREHRACMFLASAPRQWCRLLHRVGPPLELLHRVKFHSFRPCSAPRRRGHYLAFPLSNPLELIS